MSNAVDIAVEDEIDVLLEKETLDDFEQEVLTVLQTYFNNPDALTTEQDVLFKDFVDFIVEDEIAIFTQKDILTDSEQELLAALQVYESTSQPTPTSEAESTFIETSKTTPENEKGKPNFTPENALLYKRWVNYMVEQEIADLEDAEQNNEMVEGEQELLDMLGTPTEKRTTEQATLFERWVAYQVRITLADMENASETEDLSDSAQELLDMLRTVSDEPEITTVAKTENTYNSSSVQEKVVHYSEDQIKDIIADYFKALHTASPGYSIKREYVIQMGSDQRRADIVFLRNGKLVAIAECKETGRVGKGIQQLHSYLCATDTFLGIFANDGDPNKWTFWENHRHNNFVEIDRKTFENYVYNHDKTVKDRENKIKEEVQREIDAEIKERVRKNTNTDAIREAETDRIKREIMENIDRTAVVNSVRSQIAEQAKCRLLNERDEENRKLGRAQGFWWTIFGIIGIGILIALLIASAA